MARKNSLKDWTLFTCDGTVIMTICREPEVSAKRSAANIANARQQRVVYRDERSLFSKTADGGACNPLSWG